jgi:hypothetical protein
MTFAAARYQSGTSLRKRHPRRPHANVWISAVERRASNGGQNDPEEDPMTDALARLRADVARGDVLRAIKEYDRLGPDRFFSEHGFGRSRSYELVWDERRYPHKAILGTAYEFATGQRLGSGDFEGGKSGAVAVLTKLGFTVRDKQ